MDPAGVSLDVQDFPHGEIHEAASRDQSTNMCPGYGRDVGCAQLLTLAFGLNCLHVEWETGWGVTQESVCIITYTIYPSLEAPALISGGKVLDLSSVLASHL